MYTTPMFLLSLAIGTTPCLILQDKPSTTESKLIGRWKLEKSSSKRPEGSETTAEYKKGGVVVEEIRVGERTIKAEGTWRLDGDKKLIVTVKARNGKEQSVTYDIDVLDGTDLVMRNDDRVKVEFKRIKD